MPKFTDTISIQVYAGHGGAGAVSFRREKYIPKGGPDGGDGGKGGNVYLESDRRYYNMSHLFKDRKYKAGKGGQGMGDNRHGGDGDDLTVKVPPGTQVIDKESGAVIADLVKEGDRCLVAQGGIGGKGNAFLSPPHIRLPGFHKRACPVKKKK